MSNTPEWTLQRLEDGQMIHFNHCEERDAALVQSFIDDCIERAVAIIPQSLREDGRYLLFDWNAASATLNIVTTSDDKSKDSAESVQAVIEQWRSQGGASEEQTGELQFWLRDYLTTAPEFLKFSLIAVYCEGDRRRTRLL